MSRFVELVLAHPRRPCLVMGGGPSLPGQVAAVLTQLGPLADPLFLSVNEHGVKLRRCHYAVCFDSVEDKLRRYGGKTPILSPQWFADVRIANHPYLPDSAALATWAAWLMGCAPIILCGIDLYGGGATYWHSPKAESRGASVSIVEHVDRWRRVALVVPGMVRSAGGPLLAAGLFPPFEPGERVHGLPLPEFALQQAVGVTVQIQVGVDVRGRHLEPGERVELPFELAEIFLVNGTAIPP